MIPLILFILFLTAIEFYSYMGLKSALGIDYKTLRILSWGSAAITIVGVILMFNAMQSSPSNMPLYANWIFGLAFSFIMAKLFASTIFLVEDIFRGFSWLFQSVIKFRIADFAPRSYVSGFTSAALAIFTILLVNYGVWFGRYQFKTHKIELAFEHLPSAFDGYKIVQISDLHLGTFDQLKRVEKGLQKIAKENPDVILFTGDLVNNKAEEATPFIGMLNKIKAPDGKYSVLGNHDYGEYVRWKSSAEKTANHQKLIDIHGEMGFKILLNEHVSIGKGTDSLVIAGVENWGEAPFPQYGELDKTLEGKSAEDFIILLSHDPTHWRQEVLGHPAKVDLTLSGHTHGMQFGIELGRFRWSPVKYRYPDWVGLFVEAGQYLYVNRGFGSIGYPGRIGIWPEITVIELKKK